MVARANRMVLHAEDLDRAVSDLLSEARNFGLQLRSKGGRDDSIRLAADVSDYLSIAVREALEDEVVPAVESDTGGLDADEVEREVIKKALIGLKASTLRRLAEERELRSVGSAEVLATRIGRAYSWDSEEVARLVLQNEEAPPPERGHVGRLFPLADPLVTKQVLSKLDYVLGRYIRIGVARWFVFESVDRVAAGAFNLAGSYKAYQTDLDEINSRPTLRAVPTNHHASVRIAPGAPLVVSGASSLVARAAVRALETAADVTTASALSLVPADVQGNVPQLNPGSLFLLDLLHTRLPASGFKNFNLTVAKFKVGEQAGDDDESDARRPLLHAVRFEGAHLLDSLVACRLLSLERRPLVEVVCQVSREVPGQEYPGRYTLRIAVEPDHVSVTTGFGSVAPEGSVATHRAALEAAQAEMTEGVRDVGRLAELAERIATRAKMNSEPSRADLLEESS